VGLVNGESDAPLDQLRRQRVGAFCGIGNPGAFRATLAGLGADVVSFRTFADHHPYGRADVEGLHAWARALPGGAVVVTTQKDLVKLRLALLGGRPLWALRVRLEFDAGREAIDRLLEGVLPET
jgi:tetraacyldisaccharide 4'-kinase